MLDDGSLTGLEYAARNAVSCIMANPDVQNLGDSIRSGALTVCHLFCVARESPYDMTDDRISFTQLSSTDVRALVSDGKRWDLFM